MDIFCKCDAGMPCGKIVRVQTVCKYALLTIMLANGERADILLDEEGRKELIEQLGGGC